MPIYRLTEELIFPPTHLAEDGLLAIGGDLSQERLLLAYKNGIFPWYSQGDPILWWCPDPRMILLPEELHVSARLRRTLKREPFKITFDTAFEKVIRACAKAPRPHQDGTWITDEMAHAYTQLHRAGFAHSVECWEHDHLVGGLYGIALGACFFGESMFSNQTDASKVALVNLVAHFEIWGIRLIDCQVANKHLQTLGAREVTGNDFKKLLDQALHTKTHNPTWQYNPQITQDYLNEE